MSMYQGYLAIGGRDGVGTTELINAERTAAYARNIIPALGVELSPGMRAENLRPLLGYDQYGTPLSDDAVWLDHGDPASQDFLGLFPTGITGLDDSTWSASSVEYVGDGGVVQSGRNEGREIQVKGVLLASSAQGMQAGKTWLRNVLTGLDCTEDAGDCGGERLIALSAAPELCEEMEGVTGSSRRVHRCLAPYVRQFYRVSCLEGFSVTKRWETPCGPMEEVEFVLYAGVPQPHRLPEFVGRAQNEALRSATNLFPNPSFEDAETDTFAWTGAPNQSTSTRTTTSETFTNLIENPRGADTSGTVTLRENLCEGVTSRGDSTVTEGVTYDGDSWYQIDVTTSDHGVRVRGDGVTTTETHTFAVEVANPGATDIWVSVDVGDTGRAVVNVGPGERQVISATDVPNYSFAGDVGLLDTGTILFRVPTCEVGNSATPLFNGDTTPADTDLSTAWSGTPGESMSILTAPKPVGWNSTNSSLYYSTSRDCLAMAASESRPSRPYTYIAGIPPNSSTMVLSLVDTSDGAPIDVQLYRVGATVRPTQTVAVGDNTYVGIPDGVNGAFVFLLDESPAERTMYFRTAIVDGTDSYDGPWFDGDSVDTTPVPSQVVPSPSATAYQDDSWSDTRAHSLRINPVADDPRRRVSYVLNPSLEQDGSDWSVFSGGSGSRTNAAAWDGSYSYQVSPDDGVDEVSVDIGLASVPIAYSALSAYINIDTTISADLLYAQFDLLDGGAVVGSSSEVTLTYPEGVWGRVSLVLPVPSARFDSVRMTLRRGVEGAGLAWTADESIRIDGVVLEGGTTAGAYFDGSTPDTDTVTYSWRGAGGSVAEYAPIVISNRTYVDLTDGQDLPFGINGEQDYYLSTVMRMTSAQSSPLDPWARTVQVVWYDRVGGRHVEASEQGPNRAGVHTLSLRFSIPFDAASATIRLYGGGKNVTWWDSVLLTSDDRTEYFDGSMADEGGWTYSWSGQPDSSASVAEYNPIPPRTVQQQSCDTDEHQIIARRNLFLNPHPSTTQGWGKRYANEDVSLGFADDPGDASGMRRVITLTLSPDNPSNPRQGTFDLKNVGALDGSASTPSVDANTQYTVSLDVQSELESAMYLEIVEYSGPGSISGLIPGGYQSVPAGTETRLSETFTTTGDAVFVNVYLHGYIDPTQNPPSTTKVWASRALMEQGDQLLPYFDGDTQDAGGVQYKWSLIPGRSESVAEEIVQGDLLSDPDCPDVPLPPQPPVPPVACVDEPTEWTRYSVLVGQDVVPRWGSSVPIITLRTGSTEGRQVRVRFYPLVDPTNPYGYEECDYDIEFVLTYLPANAEMVIDGVTQTAMARVGGSNPISALHLLTGSQGVPYQWGELVCDRNYVMTVDIAPIAEEVSVSLDVVGRQ